MKIYIDADACPVTDIVLSVARKRKIECVILCDTAHRIVREGAQTIIVDQQADSVDFKLVNLLNADDITVTQDYGLAAMCLAKGAAAIHQNGIVYTNENIDQLLFTRFVSSKTRASGHRTKGPSKRTRAHDLAFEKALITLLESKK